MPPLKFDTSEIRNPKRTIVRRLQEAGETPVDETAAPPAPPAPSASPAGPAISFTKPRTPEERRRQTEQLIRLLRERDAGASQ